MLHRTTLLVLAVFWATMNVLLWRAEYGTAGGKGSAVSPFFVWRKILTAPDSSSLNVYHHGAKVGFCHWSTTVGAELARWREEGLPEGMVPAVTGYRIQVEGTLGTPDTSSRVRVETNLRLATNYVWQGFDLRVNCRPTSLEVRAAADEQVLHVRTEDEGQVLQRNLKFSELHDPGVWLREFGGPWSGGWLPVLSLPMLPHDPAAWVPQWQARQDSVTIGHAPVRVYRLEARWMQQTQVTVIVSRAGEILRVELPDEIVLVNDIFSNF